MLKQLFEAIKAHDTIIIHGHIKPDGDCVGAQVGLREIITATFPQKQVYLIGEESSSLQFLSCMDTITENKYHDALVIIVDTANHHRVADKRYTLGSTIFRVDHHPKSEVLGHYEWIDHSFSSTCEMLVYFFQQFKDHFSITQKGREALYYGIVTDTNRFLSPKVTKRTFEQVAYMFYEPFDVRSIYQHIYNQSEKMNRLIGHLLSHYHHDSEGIAYFIVDQQLVNQFQVDHTITGVLANQLAYIEGIDIWFVGIEDPESSQVRISLRSDQYPINTISEQFGGGGHHHASGLMLSSIEEVPVFIQAIQQFLQLNRK